MSWAKSMGTISVGAGSRAIVSSKGSPMRDHPRGCGEQDFTGYVLHGRQGPSPRVRGADVGLPALDGGGGTIPAVAGSRGAGRWGSHSPRDHPRGCGEQAMAYFPMLILSLSRSAACVAAVMISRVMRKPGTGLLLSGSGLIAIATENTAISPTM